MPANARLLAYRLSEMRGAAMKDGRSLSMDSASVLPAELRSRIAIDLLDLALREVYRWDRSRQTRTLRTDASTGTTVEYGCSISAPRAITP